MSASLSGDDAARAVIKMHTEDDLPAVEIARLLGKSESWVAQILTGRTYHHLTGGQVLSRAAEWQAARNAAIESGLAEGKTQTAIAAELGITRAAVSAYVKKLKSEGRMPQRPDPLRDRLAVVIAETIRLVVPDEDTVSGDSTALYIDGVFDVREVAAAILDQYKITGNNARRSDDRNR